MLTWPEMKPILEVHNLSKKYRINHIPGSYLSLRERILNGFKFGSMEKEDFWALDDITFMVEQGESVGIIGKNGAGKSTLLKVLSKITPPTKGKIISRGRIASLLEVGTGFHPELTGRENIFFNGSLLGMRKKEISMKFDEIVSFSAVEKFLDTPLKHFSSGMQLRLAFAVAAFLEPEILVIDEVLAVGDAEFQKKCIGKMEDVRNSGRTILFVSHNLGMVRQLCKKSIFIQGGRVRDFAGTDQVIGEYLSQTESIRGHRDFYQMGKGVALQNIVLHSDSMQSLNNAQIDFELTTTQSININSIGFYINNFVQERVGIIDLRKTVYRINDNEKLRFSVQLNSVPLIEGEYRLGMYFGSNVVIGNFDDLISFQVVGPKRKFEILDYPLEVRGKMEFDFQFEAKVVANTK